MTNSPRRGRLPGHAYPWDVVDDPAFAERVVDVGVDEVTLAAHYHSVRASTPQHPRHQVVTAPYAASYRPVRTEAWEGQRLRPAEATWMREPDPFARAANVLHRAGLNVNAWIVLNHSTRLGESNPDVAVVNCFGDVYPYALCPQHAEVRDFSANLAAETLRDVDVDGVLLEAWGQLGVNHAGLHDKTTGAWSTSAELLLSICCCGACRSAWAGRGLEGDHVVALLRDAVLSQREAKTPDADIRDLLPQGIADDLLASRLDAMARSLAGVVDAVTQTAPRIHITADAHPDPWSSSPLASALVASASRIAAVLVPAWSTAAESAEQIAVARAQAPRDMAVGAYVSVLAPAHVDELEDHATRVTTAGADDLHLYHLGLANADRLSRIAALTSAFRSRRTTGPLC